MIPIKYKPEAVQNGCSEKATLNRNTELQLRDQ